MHVGGDIELNQSDFIRIPVCLRQRARVNLSAQVMGSNSGLKRDRGQ